jgi:hypothetical protein
MWLELRAVATPYRIVDRELWAHDQFALSGLRSDSNVIRITGFGRGGIGRSLVRCDLAIDTSRVTTATWTPTARAQCVLIASSALRHFENRTLRAILTLEEPLSTIALLLTSVITLRAPPRRVSGVG